MTDYELRNVDPDDIGDLLMKVETSFDIKFLGDKLIDITSFGQLCDHIAAKIQLDNANDCTSQQAFYKLRKAISVTLKTDSDKISINSPMTDILPHKNRRSQTKKLEEYLGFKLNILRPRHWVINAFTISLLGSVVGAFFNVQIGLLGITFSIAGLHIANKTGGELNTQTVGQVAQKMAREHYLKSRRNAKTFNRNEIEKVLRDWFSDYFDLDKSKLTKEAAFI